MRLYALFMLLLTMLMSCEPGPDKDMRDALRRINRVR